MIEKQMTLDPVRENKAKKSFLEKKIDTSKDDIEESKSFLLDSLKFLKENKRKYHEDGFKDEYNKKSQEAFRDLADFFKLSGAEMISNVGEIYNYYLSGYKKLVIRREDPEKIVDLVDNGKISLNFDTKIVGDRGDKYANCALWPHGSDSMEGITNSFLEGHGAAGYIVTLMAIDPEKGNSLTIEEPEGKMMQIGTLSRGSVKILSGDIKKKNLEFIITRVPKKFFSEDLLTEREKTNPEITQIFRGFVFSDKLKNITRNKN